MWTAAAISRGFDLVFLMDKLRLLAPSEAARFACIYCISAAYHLDIPSLQVNMRGDRERRRAELSDQSVMIEAFGACGETIHFAAQYQS